MLCNAATLCPVEVGFSKALQTSRRQSIASIPRSVLTVRWMCLSESTNAHMFLVGDKVTVIDSVADC